MAEEYPVNVVFEAVDRIAAPMRRINSRIERMTGPLRRLNNRFRALARESGLMRLRESIGRVGSAMGGVLRQFGRLASRLAFIGGLAGTALVRLVSGVARTGDELAKSARSMGISVEFLQEYQFAAERVGVSQSVLNTSFVAFSKRLGEMKNGYGRLRTLLKETNPDLMAQLEATRSTEEAFGLLMGAMEQIEDPARRSALAAAAFSRQGVRLTNIAIAGSEEIARLRRRAHELGLVLDEEALASSERYQDSLTNMRSAMAGLRNIIGAALMPVFADLMDRMTIFFVNNREAIREWAQSFAASVPERLEAMRDAAVSLLDRLQPLIDSLRWMSDAFGTGEPIVDGLAVLMGGPLLASVAALGVKVLTLIAAIASTPIGWFLAGVAGMAAAVWGASQAVDYVRDVWPAAWQAVSDVIGGVIDTFGALWDLLTGNFTRLQERIQRMAEAASRLIPDLQVLQGDGPRLRVQAEGGAGEFGGAQGAAAIAGHRPLDRRRLVRRENRIAVEIDGVPRGSRLEREGDDEAVSVGARYALGS